MKKTKATLLTVGIVTSTAIIFSCGGGGGGGSSAEGSIKIEPAKTEDIEKLVSSVNKVANTLGNLNNATGAVDTMIKGNVASTSTKTSYKVVPFMLKNIKNFMSKGITPQESRNYDENCTYGGSIKGQISWTNPNCQSGEEDACWKNNRIKGYLTAINCQEENVVYNGKVSFDINLDRNGKLTYLNTSTDNFKIDLDNATLNIPYDYLMPDLSIIIKVNPDEYYSLSTDGNFIGKAATSNVKDIKFSFSRLKTELDEVKKDEYGDPIEEKFTLNGGLSIFENSSKIFDVRTKNFSIYEKYGTILNDPDTARINGYLYEGVCTNKWFKIETIEDIKYPENKTCPTAGKVKVNGNVTIEATEQGGIIISDGNKTKTYNSCKDLSAEEDVCTM